MNREYVESLERPDNDPERIRFNAKDLVDDKVFAKNLINYAINNFLEATQAYYDDFDSNKLYFQVHLFDETISLCFDVEYLAHILGFGNYRYLKEAAIINFLIHNKTDGKRLTPKNWLEMFKEIFQNGKEDIINHDSDPANIFKKKLNWDKISEKLYCFLNLGIISEKEKSPTVFYREDVTRGKESGIVMVKDVISKDIKGQIRMRLDYGDVFFEKGRKERMLVPVSIEFFANPNDDKFSSIIMNGKKYRFGGKLVITQMMGGSYGK